MLREKGKTQMLITIAKVPTFATANRRDKIRRLMGMSKYFRKLTYPQAYQAYRYAEENGLLREADGFLTIYHETGEHVPYLLQVFAERLKLARKAAGLKQTDLAEKAHMSKQTISAYETERQPPTLERAASIASVLNVSLDWLCGFNKEYEK